MVQSITKYAQTITDKNSIKYHLDKAIWLAKNGRPGPVWIDIPLDIQAKEIDISELEGFSPEEFKPKLIKNFSSKISNIYDLILDSKMPVILVGNGVRLSRAEKEFKILAEKLGIPILLSWKNCCRFI